MVITTKTNIIRQFFRSCSYEKIKVILDSHVFKPEDNLYSSAENLEQVMNNGMQFLSGLFKMATGKEMGTEGQKNEVNKETGEVTMKFKLPM